MDSKDDDGVKLVDEYADLISRQREIRERLDVVKEMDKEKGFQSQQGDGSIAISPEVVVKLGDSRRKVEGGDWQARGKFLDAS